MQWKELTTCVRHKPDQGYGTFEAVCGPVRIVVTNSDIYFPGKWIASAYMTIDVRLLRATTPEEAQKEAIEVVRSWLEYGVESLRNLES